MQRLVRGSELDVVCSNVLREIASIVIMVGKFSEDSAGLLAWTRVQVDRW